MWSKIKDLILGVLFGLLSAGLILLVSRPRSGQAILLRPPPTLPPLVVNIDGAVINPGVYRLPLHARVNDAVEAAGGFTPDASPGSVNLASVLDDGSHIYIPARIPENENLDSLEGNVVVLSESGGTIRLININQASSEDLISLPGIGPVTAEKIIAYRQEHLFTRIEEIMKVPGIGPATYENIEAYLTVGE